MSERERERGRESESERDRDRHREMDRYTHTHTHTRTEADRDFDADAEYLSWASPVFDCLIFMQQDGLERLRVVHIAGSKGKGSVAAFTERLLRDQGFKTGLFTCVVLLCCAAQTAAPRERSRERPRERERSRERVCVCVCVCEKAAHTGACTHTHMHMHTCLLSSRSPHLIEARERIRVNGAPISRELFASSLQDMAALLDESECVHVCACVCIGLPCLRLCQALVLR